MRRSWWMPSVVCGLVMATTVLAQGSTAPGPVVARAVRAAGGPERLGRLRGIRWRARGKFFGAGLSSDFTGEWAQQAPDRIRVEVDAEANGRRLHIVSVFNRDRGWVQLDGETREMSREEAAEAREQIFASDLTRLVLLRGQGIRLESVAEARVGGRPTVGIRVVAKGHRDVRLFFDKETSLLAVIESRIHDDIGGKEVLQESVHSEYREVDGLKLPSRVVVRRAGKPYLEAELSGYRLAEKLDGSLFEKP